MKHHHHHLLLDLSIEDLELSREFKQTCLDLGIDSLSELTLYKSHELLQLPGFNARILHQYICFMESMELGALIPP